MFLEQQPVLRTLVGTLVITPIVVLKDPLTLNSFRSGPYGNSCSEARNPKPPVEVGLSVLVKW